jgi:hypothetical protein
LIEIISVSQLRLSLGLSRRNRPKEARTGLSWISPVFSLRASAGTTDIFWCISEWRKMSSLRDSLISGFEPLVSNRSFGAIFEHANALI